MKKLLICAAFGTSLSAWAVAIDPQLNCQALVTSQTLLRSESLFKKEIVQIIRASVPTLYDDLKIKIHWGQRDNFNYSMIRKDEAETHQTLPQIPPPRTWPRRDRFRFTVVVLGTSNQAIGTSIKSYEILSYARRGKTIYGLSVEASEGSKVDLLNLYAALTAAPFVEGVIFEQDVAPTQMSYPNAPIPLSEPAELRAIRAFRQFGSEAKRREEVAEGIKPGIVQALQSGRHLQYRGLILTGFSERSDIVDYAKAASFTIEYIFSLPSDRR